MTKGFTKMGGKHTHILHARFMSTTTPLQLLHLFISAGLIIWSVPNRVWLIRIHYVHCELWLAWLQDNTQSSLLFVCVVHASRYCCDSKNRLFNKQDWTFLKVEESKLPCMRFVLFVYKGRATWKTTEGTGNERREKGLEVISL
jgi:hypothetical protein